MASRTYVDVIAERQEKRSIHMKRAKVHDFRSMMGFLVFFVCIVVTLLAASNPLVRESDFFPVITAAAGIVIGGAAVYGFLQFLRASDHRKWESEYAD